MAKALMIIDMLVRDMPKLNRDPRQLIRNQVRLVEAFRSKGCKVIIVGGSKDGRVPVRSMRRRNPVMFRLWGDEDRGKNGAPLPPRENMVVPELLNGYYSLYLHKHEYSAFYRTGLEGWLRRNHVTELYLAGISTGVCVYFTGADAAMRGIQPVLITDASASPDQRHNILNFRTILGPAMSTREVLRLLG